MKKFLALSLVVSSVAMAADSYSNFPTISSEFKSSEACASWMAEKTAKYGERIIASASGCSVERERVMGSGSIKAPQYKKIVVGKVVLDTL